jgi:hypothetical protein
MTIQRREERLKGSVRLLHELYITDNMKMSLKNPKAITFGEATLLRRKQSLKDTQTPHFQDLGYEMSCAHDKDAENKVHYYRAMRREAMGENTQRNKIKILQINGNTALFYRSAPLARRKIKIGFKPHI